MPLAGKHLLPREIAAAGASIFPADLVRMVATALGESAGYVGAWHDNSDDVDGVISRDCGLMQINIDASEIGTSVETRLRTTDRVGYKRVLAANVAAAHRLYSAPGPNHGIRRWEPWVAYTTGWATFPAWWTWHELAGKPIGPWVPTGRYLQRAIVGVANYHLLIAKDLSAKQALGLATNYAEQMGVDGSLVVSGGIVGWAKIAEKPTSPPADGIGPRPVPNGG